MILQGDLLEQYTKRYKQALVPLAANLEVLLRDVMSRYPRIDRVSVRPKSVDRFMIKAGKISSTGQPKYTDPLNDIQDQIGARVIGFYVSDIERIAQIVRDFFGAIEEQKIEPDSTNEFAYEGRHFVLLLPLKDIGGAGVPEMLRPTVFELQIKTLFEHAWSEANHDLAYKPSKDLTHEQRRFIAYTAAQAWGTDQIFDNLASELLPRD